MQFDREKLKAVILYTCAKCEPSKLGAVKLHKVLYFTDMLHYAHVGAPVTGSTYRKRALGPTCDALLPTLRELEKEGAVNIREADYFGYRKKEYLPLVEPDIWRLSEIERALLDEVIEFVCLNNSAKTISDYSHNRAWEMAAFGDVLKYNSVFNIFPSQVSQEAMDWAAGEVDSCVSPRPEKETVAYAAYPAFRKRVLQARGV